MTKLDRIVAEVKRRLLTGDDFSETWCWYCEHFTTLPEAVGRGAVPSRSPAVAKLLHVLADRLFQGRGDIQGLMLFKLRRYKLVHGTCRMNGYDVALFYFEGLRRGMLAVRGLAGEGMTHYFRTSALEIEGAGPGTYVVPETNAQA